MCVCVCLLQVEKENGCQDMFDFQDTLEREENGCHGDNSTTSDDEDEPLGWTEEEKALVQPVLELVKVLPLTAHTCR